MDPKGAQHLRRRLDSHAQWQRAAVVRMGSSRAQTPTDLIEFEEEVRRYRDGLCKRLVDGCRIAALEDDSAV